MTLPRQLLLLRYIVWTIREGSFYEAPKVGRLW
jgi:hypothetical protein